MNLKYWQISIIQAAPFGLLLAGHTFLAWYNGAVNRALQLTRYRR